MTLLESLTADRLLAFYVATKRQDVADELRARGLCVPYEGSLEGVVAVGGEVPTGPATKLRTGRVEVRR